MEERGSGEISLATLNELQLFAIVSKGEFSNDLKSAALTELQRRENLRPETFALVYPDSEIEQTGETSGGFYNSSGIEIELPLRRLVLRDENGEIINLSKPFV